MTPLTCPVCRIELFRRTASGVEIDICPRCTRTWFDYGEIEAYACHGTARVPETNEGFAARAGDGHPWTCPRCGEEKLTEGAIGKFPVHQCLGCRGVYASVPQLYALAGMPPACDGPRKWFVEEGGYRSRGPSNGEAAVWGVEIVLEILVGLID